MGAPLPYPHLFSEAAIGRLMLRNRLVMAPMETNLATPGGEVTQAMIAYYRERAAGGVGMVIVEFTCVDRPVGLGSPLQLGLDSDALIPGHRALARAIREAGARACLQLHHAGRQTGRRATGGAEPVAPSVIESPLFRTRPRALTVEEIRRIVERFASAARRAVEAGYEAIELHGAHGYLLGQFLSPYTNRRDDEYGGDEERRLRFPAEVIAAVRRAIGPDVPLIYRLSAAEFVDGGLTIDDTVRVAPRLAAAGADALHVSTGIGERLDTNVDPISTPEGWRLPFARAIRRAAGVPVIAVGVIRRPEMAEAAIADGTADFVALGRALLVDPRWPAKARAGRADAIRPCTSCNWCIDRLARHAPVGCAENPRVGREGEPGIRPVGGGRTAVVVGGGPGGLVSALLLDQAGFRVVLFEADDRLGGGLVVSAAPPHKEKLLWYRDYLLRRLAASRVEVRLGRRAAIGDVVAEAPAFVVLATGAVNREVEIDGLPSPRAAFAYDILAGRTGLGPGPLVVYGGGETGCETAEYAAGLGYDVALVTRSPAERLARSAEFVYRQRLLARLLGNPRVTVVERTRIAAVRDDLVTLESETGVRREIRAGQVLLAQGRRREGELAGALAGLGVPHAVVGDGREAGRIGDAVNGAYLAVRTFTGGAAASGPAQPEDAGPAADPTGARPVAGPEGARPVAGPEGAREGAGPQGVSGPPRPEGTEPARGAAGTGPAPGPAGAGGCLQFEAARGLPGPGDLRELAC